METTDTLSPGQRSARMALIHARDTKPELAVRRLLHGLGYRYRLHVGALPGRPDLVFASRRKVIFVHGCFWHQHASATCKLARLPKSRLDFWLPKLERNRERDRETRAALRRLGWRALVVWECGLRDLAAVERRTRRFMEDA